jgi:hypothetical protein
MNISQTIAGAFASARGVMGVTVVYRRGSDLVELTALPGSTVYGVADAEGYIVEKTVHRDYIIEAADLVLNRARVEPTEGDTLEEVIDGERLTFRVVYPDGATDQPFTYSDTTRTQIRVHTVNTVNVDA